MPRKLSLEEKFWSKVLKTKTCWVWTGCFMSSGYGQTYHNGKCIGAHRASIIISGREIPEGAHVMHACDNKKCVNPAHLKVGTQFENYRDYANKKIDKELKADIENMRISNAQLIEKYDCALGTLRRIASDKGWGWNRQQAIWREEQRKARKK